MNKFIIFIISYFNIYNNSNYNIEILCYTNYYNIIIIFYNNLNYNNIS
jgi:hypothetical protein